MIDKIKQCALDSPTIQRLIDEIKNDQEELRIGRYNRASMTHNRSGSYNRVTNRHNR